MDWAQIKLPEIPEPKRRVQSGPLASLDYYKFVVACELLSKSQASQAQTALNTYLLRNWAEHEQRLVFLAAQRGLTPEQLFEELIRSALKIESDLQ